MIKIKSQFCHDEVFEKWTQIRQVVDNTFNEKRKTNNKHLWPAW